MPLSPVYHDTVSVENLAPQGFWESDLGRPKVEAVAGIAKRQYPAIELTEVPERFRASTVRSWPTSHEVAVSRLNHAISVKTVYKLVAQGKLRANRATGKLLVEEESLIRLMDGNPDQAMPEEAPPPPRRPPGRPRQSDRELW